MSKSRSRKAQAEVTEIGRLLLFAFMRNWNTFVRRSTASLLAAVCFFVAVLGLLGCGSVAQTTLTSMPEGNRINTVSDTLLTEAIGRALQPNGTISRSALRGDSALTTFLVQTALVRTDVFPSRLKLLAFWINAYNASVLDMLRMNPAARSIDDIGGFESAKLLYAGGEQYALDDISQNILVKNFREPRAFFALYDGTRTSPGLYPEAFTEAKLSDQLDAHLRAFLADTTKNWLDPQHNLLYLSPVFQQYSDELEKAAGTVIAFVRTFAPSTMGAWIDAHPLLKISYLPKDKTIFSSDIVSIHDAVQQQSHPQSQPTEQQQRKQPRKSSGGIQ